MSSGKGVIHGHAGNASKDVFSCGSGDVHTPAPNPENLSSYSQSRPSGSFATVWAAMGVTIGDGAQFGQACHSVDFTPTSHLSPRDTARGGVPESNKSRPECAKPAGELFGAAPATPGAATRSVAGSSRADPMQIDARVDFRSCSGGRKFWDSAGHRAEPGRRCASMRWSKYLGHNIPKLKWAVISPNLGFSWSSFRAKPD
jgi:hypothetical protein